MKESKPIKNEVAQFMHGLEKRNPYEIEFHQAVREFAEAVMPYIHDHTKYRDAQILERMTEPDRIIIFRVTWEADDGSFLTLLQECCAQIW